MSQQKTMTDVKIKDISAFTKLFKVNIPWEEHFDYYVDVLKQSSEFKNIDVLINDFANFEKWVEENGYESVEKYKMKSLDIVKDYLLNTKAYQRFNTRELSKEKNENRDWINKVSDTDILLSIDFSSANYSVLKTFDADDELSNSWADLCKLLGIHEVLVSSKSFRQLVFGNTNPKRFQTMQHEKVMTIVNYYLRSMLRFDDENIIFISHDEIVLRIKGADDASRFIGLADEILSGMVSMPIKCTIFSLEKIRKNIFIKTVYSLYTSVNFVGYGLYKEYKALFGAPGNKFYMFFKKYILDRPMEDRDLVYMNDGELCKWVVQEEKPKKSPLPHYDKPEYIISIESAKTDYSYIWNEMTKILPNMTNEEKRRVIEIVANTCSHCHQRPVGCHCWNDD